MSIAVTEAQPWKGQPRVPWYKKINPIWWFGNVEGIDPTYHTDWPQWRREFVWYVIRNPLFNFFRFVVGVEDRDLIVTGPEPVFTPAWIECSLPSTGWKWAILRTGWVVLPFLSYSGSRMVFYFGWVPSGRRLSLKFNFRN
jgi:hypothetical protein